MVKFTIHCGSRLTRDLAPIHDRIRLESKLTKINGTFWPPDNPSVARQMTNESESQWEEWEIQRIIPVTAAQIRAMGVDPSTVSKLEDEDWELGDDAYMAVLDVYHQLHCLRILRQIAFPERYPNISKGRERPLWRTHVDHCVDILMQQLQCSGNVNLVTQHWVENHEWPFPIFSINRQCVDFEALTRWRRENSIDMDKYERIIKKPPGVKQLRAADDFYKYDAPDIPNPNHLNGANADEHVVM